MDCSLRTSFSLAAIWHHNHALMHGLCPLYVMAYVSHNTSDRAESVLHSQDVYKEYYFYMAMHPPLSHSKTIFLVVAVLLKYSCKHGIFIATHEKKALQLCWNAFVHFLSQCFVVVTKIIQSKSFFKTIFYFFHILYKINIYFHGNNLFLLKLYFLCKIILQT